MEGRFDRRSASFAMVPFFFCIAVRRVVHFCAYLFSYSPLPLSSAPSPVVYVRAFCVCLYTSRPGLVCFFLLQHTLSFARRCTGSIQLWRVDFMGWQFMTRMDSEMLKSHSRYKVYNGNVSLDSGGSTHQLRDVCRWSNRLGKSEKSVNKCWNGVSQVRTVKFHRPCKHVPLHTLDIFSRDLVVEHMCDGVDSDLFTSRTFVDTAGSSSVSVLRGRNPPHRHDRTHPTMVTPIGQAALPILRRR